MLMFKKISLLVAPLALLGLVMVAPQPTHALSCVQPVPNSEFIANGGVVFHGQVSSNTITALNFDESEKREVTFNTFRAWSPAWAPTRKVTTPFTVVDTIPAGSSDDDIWGFRSTFEVGKEYIVYASYDGSVYTADIGACARSHSYSTESLARITSELGVGYTPAQTSVTPPTTDPEQNALLAQLKALLALVADLQARIFNMGGGSDVSDFKSCSAKTGVVLESYPRKCVYDGVTYVEPVSPILPSPISCPNLSQNLGLGARNADVTALQTYLRTTGDFRYPEITGFFGPATTEAVRIFQCREMGVCSGNENSSGYGFVGPQTRAALFASCGGVVEPGPIACTREYRPVCGQPSGCEPCNAPAGGACPAICKIPQVQTYGNACEAKAAGASVVYEGQCKIDEPINPTTPPDSCRIWNDGCNTCSRNSPGSEFACTLRACIWQGVPKCEAHFDQGANPVIHGFTGPTVLGVRETGVWEIKASDPQNGTLSYKVDWGESRFANPFDSIASLAGSGFVQQTTFTHSYSQAGTYTISIVARDNQGLEAKTTTTVRVGESLTGEGFTVTPNFGNAPHTVTATITLPTRSGFDLVEVCGPIVVGDINWGDGQTSRPTRLGCSSQRVVTLTHTYQNNGNYTVTFKKTNGVVSSAQVTVGGVTPGVTFTASPSVGNAPLAVTFTAPGGYSCADGPDYEIDFGDGSKQKTPQCTSGNQRVTHTYSRAGTYSAKLYSIPSGFGIAPVDRTPRLVGTQNIFVSGTSGLTCTAGGVAYSEGTERSCIDGANGSQQCIIDAIYACRSGSWEVESQPWGPTCQGGTNYGGGFYEDCISPSNNLSVYQPSGGFYRIGDSIQVRWSTNVQNANAGMYLVLEDEASGRRYKSMKVERSAGQATINTGGSCNAFFSDGIEADCSSLRDNSFKGNVRYVIRAVIYTPSNACFGFCALGSTTNTQTIIQSTSAPFTLGV